MVLPDLKSHKQTITYTELKTQICSNKKNWHFRTVNFPRNIASDISIHSGKSFYLYFSDKYCLAGWVEVEKLSAVNAVFPLKENNLNHVGLSRWDNFS